MLTLVAVACAVTALMGVLSLQMANAAEEDQGVMGSWSRNPGNASLGDRLLSLLGLSNDMPVNASSVTLPDGATGWGIDVSFYQGNIDWAKVKATGIDFVILRAGYGRGGVDSKFSEYVKGCRDNGIRFGVYWFAYSWDAASAKREAETTLTRLSDNGITPQNIDFPVYYDLEYESKTTGRPAGVDDNDNVIEISGAENFAAIAKAYCDVIKAAGYTPGYYSNLNWNRNYLTDPYFDTIDRWYAQYNVVPTFNKSFSIWQHTSSGSVDGIGGAVDMNYSYGNFLDGVHGGNGGDTTPKTASFTAEKTATGAPADGAVPGTRLTYSLKVTNTGTADITDIRYTDPMLGATDATDAPTSKDTLAAGESEQFDIGTYTVTQADVDGKASVDNTATVSASAPDASAAPADQTATVSTQTKRTSGIDLTKTARLTTDADGDGLADVGDVISYSFTVRNTGTVTLSSVKLTDAMLGIDDMEMATNLAADGTATYDATQTHTVTDADETAGKVDNTASVTGIPVYGSDATDTATTSTPVDRGLVDALDVVKTATFKTDRDGDGKADPGDVLSYKVTIRNTSTRALTNLMLTDTLLGIEDKPIKDTLAVGETVSIDGLPDYTVTVAEAKKGTIKNIAAARATNGANDLVKDGIALTPADTPKVGMSMSMKATMEDGSSITKSLGIGDVIKYAVTIENTGNVDIPTIHLSDTLGAMPKTVDGGITAGNSKTVEGTYTVTVADMDRGDMLDEKVTASADAAEGMPLSDVTATADMPLDSVAGLTAHLTADIDQVTDAEVGTPVSWTLTVENTGTRTMTGIHATAGDGTDIVLSKTELAPGETAQARISHPVTQAELDAGKTVLTLTASGNDKLGNDIDVHGNESAVTLVPKKDETGNGNANANENGGNGNGNESQNQNGNENAGNGNQNGNDTDNGNGNGNHNLNGNENENQNQNTGNENANGNTNGNTNENGGNGGDGENVNTNTNDNAGNQNTNANGNENGNGNANENGNGNGNSGTNQNGSQGNSNTGNNGNSPNQNQNQNANGNTNTNGNGTNTNTNTNTNEGTNQNQPGNSIAELSGMKVLLNNKVMTDFDVNTTSYTWNGKASDNLISVTGIPTGWKKSLTIPSNGVGLFKLSVISPDGKIDLLYSINVRAAAPGGNTNQNGSGGATGNTNAGTNVNGNRNDGAGNGNHGTDAGGNQNGNGDKGGNGNGADAGSDQTQDTSTGNGSDGTNGNVTQEESTDGQGNTVPMTQVNNTTNDGTDNLLQTGDNLATSLAGILSASVASVGIVALSRRKEHDR